MFFSRMFVFFVCLFFSWSASAQDRSSGASDPPAGVSGQADIEEIRRQVDILAEEVERLRSGEPEVEMTSAEAQQLGLGPSAASVYRRSRGLSFAGYGEMLYENFDDSDESGTPVENGAQLDFLRAVFYFGYRFSEKFVFNSEIELEHANEVGVEFAYVDYLAHPAFNVRGGLLLLPVGLANEFHEPNVFLTAHRPVTEQRIIPSTWRENGAGVHGTAGMFSYRAYIVNGLNAAGFSASSLRGGRQKGSRTKITNPAYVGRLDISPVPGAFFGGSVYSGGSAQDQFVVDGRKLDVNTTLWELHGQVQIRGVDFRGLFARATLDEVAELNRARGLTGSSSVGQANQGGYVQLGYNVLSQFRDNTAVMPYYRFEKINTQDEVPAGFSADPGRDETFHTLGVELRPISNIVVKSDYTWARNQAQSGLNQFSIQLGYSF